MYNEISLDTLCGALAYAIGVDAPKFAAPADERLVSYVNEKFAGEKADRIFMYNPDAIAQWISEKYSDRKNLKNLSVEYEYNRDNNSIVFAVATFSFE